MTNHKKLPVIVTGYQESIVNLTEQVHPEGKEKKFYIEGLAIPFNTISSNGVLYTKESLIETAPLWIGLPIMYNHLIEGEALPVGKVVEMQPGILNNKEGMLYKAEIDPMEEKIVGKIQRGFLNKVSIHILPAEISGKEGYQEAVVGRPLELSIVPVPGFSETNMASYVEKLKQENVGEEKMTETQIKVEPTAVPEKDNKYESLNIEITKMKRAQKELLGIVEELVDNEEDTGLIGNVAEQEASINDIVDVLGVLTNRLDRIEELLAKIADEETSEEVAEEKKDEEINEVPTEEIKDSALPVEEPVEEKIVTETKAETVKTETKAEAIIKNEVDIAKEAIKSKKSNKEIKILLRDL